MWTLGFGIQEMIKYFLNCCIITMLEFIFSQYFCAEIEDIAVIINAIIWRPETYKQISDHKLRSQAFDVSGVSEYTGISEYSNMVRNRIFYIEIQSIEKDGNTPTAHCRYPLTYFGFAKYSKCKYQRE